MRETLSGPEVISVTELGAVARRITFSSAATPGGAPSRIPPAARSGVAPRPARSQSAGAPEPIGVVLRVRPLADAETRDGPPAVVIDKKRSGVVHVIPKNPALHNAAIRANQKASFRFSTVYDESAGQQQLFQETTYPLVEALFHGTDGLVFAYGTSNAGKTYTIQGSVSDPGILPRSLDVIFNSISVAKQGKPARDGEDASAVVAAIVEGGTRDGLELPEESKVFDAHPSRESDSVCDVFSSERCREETVLEISPEPTYEVIVSYLEIYNEQCFDLLEPSARSTESRRPQEQLHAEHGADPSESKLKETYVPAKPSRPVKRRVLKLKENRVEAEVYAEGLTEVPVATVEDVQRLLAYGQRNRSVAQTCVNQRSSRSHTIFSIKLLQKVPLSKKGVAKATSYRVTSSKLSIVDLAGNERTSRTNTGGVRLKEASHINTSLMNLGHCLEAMRKNQRNEGPNPRVLAPLNPNSLAPVARRAQPGVKGSKHVSGDIAAKAVNKASTGSRVPVPFRQSRLTRLFQRNLETGAAVMIVNVSPASCDADETIHSLKRAAVAREVSTAPTQKRARTVVPDQKHLISPSVLRDVRKKYETKATEDVRKIAGLEAENAVYRAKLEECQLEFDSERAKFEAERDELESELDTMCRENERLLDRLARAEAQRAVREEELRDEITRETARVLAERSERHRQQLAMQLESAEEAARARTDVVTNTARKQISSMAARHREAIGETIARRVSLAIMPPLFGDEDEEEEDEEGDDEHFADDREDEAVGGDAEAGRRFSLSGLEVDEEDYDYDEIDAVDEAKED